MDDTRWAPSGNSFILVTDTSQNLIYRIDFTGGFPAGAMYSAGQGSVLIDDASTGAMLPVIFGMNAPHGIAFIQE